jgi:hypothetical protein
MRVSHHSYVPVHVRETRKFALAVSFFCRRRNPRRMTMVRNSGQRMQPVWQSSADVGEQSGADVYRRNNAGAVE